MFLGNTNTKPLYVIVSYSIELVIIRHCNIMAVSTFWYDKCINVLVGKQPVYFRLLRPRNVV